MTLATHYIGWCPVCERDIKVRNGRLVHHGYERPGIGYIVGDCFGVGYPPHEMNVECCAAYLESVNTTIDQTTHYLLTLLKPGGPALLTFTRYEGRDDVRGNIVHLSKAEADALEAQLPAYERGRYSWQERLHSTIAETRSQLSFWEKERQRIERLISSWTPKPLRTIEEEIQKQDQTRKERDDARSRARDEKVAAEVAKTQQRIDAALRTKNAAVLADIYSSTKIRERSGWRLSKEEALSLLDRDDVWRAFGLLTPDGYVTGNAAKETLDTMTWGRRVPSSHYAGGYDRVPLAWPESLGGGKAKTRR